jgi:hypothetical protein
MHAILVPITPPLRMLCFAAFLEDNVLIYHFAAHRAVPDGGVVAPVIQIRTRFPFHGDFIFSFQGDPLSIIPNHRSKNTKHFPTWETFLDGIDLLWCETGYRF